MRWRAEAAAPRRSRCSRTWSCFAPVTAGTGAAWVTSSRRAGIAPGPMRRWTRPSRPCVRRSGSSPISAYAHANLGVALMRQGKLDEAIAEYREAIRLRPDDGPTHFNLGTALGRQGKLDEADRRVPRGDPAPARLRLRPLQPRPRPAGSGEGGRGDRRVSRGDPAPARLRPRQPRQRPDAVRGSWTRRSPSTARRSGSSPTTTSATTTSATS